MDLIEPKHIKPAPCTPLTPVGKAVAISMVTRFIALPEAFNTASRQAAIHAFYFD